MFFFENCTVRLKVIGAANEQLLTVLANQGVVLRRIRYISPLELELWGAEKYIETIKHIVDQMGSSVEVVEKSWILKKSATIRKRPLIAIGVIIYLIMAFYLPTRVLFVKVDGNCLLSENRIIDAAADYGVYFGASRKLIRNESVKNALLVEFPELQWVGVNSYGCVAVIQVVERSRVETQHNATDFCSIVADRAGTIEEIVISRGNLRCKVGDVVSAGQILVSRFVDTGQTVKTISAEAEIYAKTERTLEIIKPFVIQNRNKPQTTKMNFSLLLGKYQINLFKDSSNSVRECVKIYERRNLTLPGGFVLPIGIVKETLIFSPTEDKIVEDQVAYDSAVNCAQSYLENQMIAGEILDASETHIADDDVLRILSDYTCREMIGRDYYEEIYLGNE